MKSIFYFAFALTFFCAPVLSHGAHLKGRVVLVGKHDETTQAQGVDVTLKETGDTVRTKAQGLFRMFIPEYFKAGEKITLLVDKKGYRIQYPLDGEVLVPAELTKSMVEIRLLPIGSKKFWSEDRIEKFITNIAEQTKAQIHPEGSPKTINFTKAIREWATNYGFSAAQAKAEIDKWVAQVKEKEDDLHKLGLAAFAEKKFGKAESLFKQSAGAKIKSLKAAKAQEQQLTIEIISDYRLAGDSAYNNYKFHEAMNNYEIAASYATRESQPRLWAQIQILIGNASAQKGIRAESHEANEYLKKSVAVYRNALKVYARDQLPQDWATTQNNLGNALKEQGIRTGGEQGKTLLAEAVEAYRNALKVRTRDQLPQQWAMTQNNLGIALKEQGIRTGGEQGKTLLAEAVEAFESALEVFKAARMGWHVGITEKNIDEAMRAKRFWRRRSKPTATPCQEELNAIDGGK